MDAINLETGRLETLQVREFMKEYGRRLVGVERVISVLRDGQPVAWSPAGFDYDSQPWTVNFEGLVRDTPFAAQMRTVLDVLTAAFRSPFELKFASNGHDRLSPRLPSAQVRS